MRRLLIIPAVLVLAAGAARAQEIVPSAGGASVLGAPDEPAADGTARLAPPERLARAWGDPVAGPCGLAPPPAAGQPTKADKSPHGEVFAGAGTHGYREAGGVVCQPIGDHTAVIIGLDVSRWGREGWGR